MVSSLRIVILCLDRTLMTGLAADVADIRGMIDTVTVFRLKAGADFIAFGA